MLFDTVDGLDLKPFYNFLLNLGPTEETNLRQAFVPFSKENGKTAEIANFNSVRNFLKTVGFIKMSEDGKWVAKTFDLPFRLALLERMQCIHRGTYPSENDLDYVYWEMLDKIFVRPETHYVSHLHSTIAESGVPNIGETKVVTWRKVIQTIGLGKYDNSRGFYFYVPEDLICEILSCWTEEVSDLQSFLQDHWSRFLPFENRNGDLSKVLVSGLEALSQRGILSLSIKQDSPTRMYTEHRWREIRVYKEQLAYV